MKAIGSVLSVLLVTSLTVGPGETQAARAGEQPQDEMIVLGETNVIRGSESRSVRVVLPAPVRISPIVWDNPDLEVEGFGEFPGIVLVSEDFDQESPVLIAGRAPEDSLCSGSDCPATEYILSTFPTDGPTGPYMVPAGSYVLYLLAYGSPVTVKLTLGGLSGTREIEPKDAAHLDSYRMAPRLSVPAQSLYWDGAFRSMDGPGLVFIWSALVSNHVLNDEMAHCRFSEEPPPPTDYIPTCPGGDSTAFSQTWVGAPVFRHQMLGFEQTTGGGSGVGYWHVATHPVERTTALAFWLTY